MSSRQVYNKIVRDRIPEVIAEKGDTAEIVTVDRDEAIGLLKEKLIEEATEASQENDAEGLTAELADLQEVIMALMEENAISAKSVEMARQKKLVERGGFKKRIKLIATH